MIILAPKFLGLGLLDSAILGTVIAAVSPAVIVPKMLKLMEEGYGADRSIPQMIMAGASVDDVFVIVLFTSFIGLTSTGSFSMLNLIKIPTSIFFGISVGFLCAILLIYLFKKIHIRDSLKVIIILNISFLLVTFEHSLTGIIGFSGLLAIMSIGTGIQAKNTMLSKRMSIKYSKLWIAAEVMLFVLVGATVNIKYALSASIPAILLIITVLIFRMIGVFRNISFLQGTIILHDCIFSKSYCSGSYWLHTFVYGTSLRKYNPYSCSTFYPYNCPFRSFCN